MSRNKVSDFIATRLGQWGVERCYGYPGPGIGGILSSMKRVQESPEFIQVQHEESAGFMACAESKFTDGVGVCISGAGPGALHLLTGLHDAKMDHQPAVAIIGQTARQWVGSGLQPETDLNSICRDLSSEYLFTIKTPEQAPHAIDRAVRTALDRRTVTTVIVPSDVQSMTIPDSKLTLNGGSGSRIRYAKPHILPPDEELQSAADILNKSNRPAILIGAGARVAADELETIAGRLHAGVAKTLSGKDILSDEYLWVTGCIGPHGTDSSDYMLRNCDALLVIGTTFPYMEFLQESDQVGVVQIDREAKSLSVNHAEDVNLIGDSKTTLNALLPMVCEQNNLDWRKDLERRTGDWWKKLERSAFMNANPINPQRIFWETSQVLPDKAILCADSGSSTSWFARDILIRKDMKASVSGQLSSMGASLPYAISAKFACPDRIPVVFVGDGSMQMLGLSNLVTIANYWRTWSSPRLVICILNNRELAYVSPEIRALDDDHDLDISLNIPDIQYAEFAKSLGLAGMRIERPEYIPEIIVEAFHSDVPYVIEAVTDPNF